MSDEQLIGTLRGDLWQPLSTALAPLGLGKHETLAVIEAMAADAVCPVFDAVAEPPPDHREVLHNPVTKQFYAVRKPDVPNLYDLAKLVTAASLGFTEHKEWGAVGVALSSLLWFARSGVVGLDPIHALVLRAIKQGPPDGSRVAEIAESMAWSVEQVDQALKEILERREGLLKQSGDLWQALV